MKWLKRKQEGPWIYDTFQYNPKVETVDTIKAQYFADFPPQAYDSTLVQVTDREVTLKRWYTAD